MSEPEPVEPSADELLREAHKALSLLQQLLPKIVEKASAEAAEEVVARVVRAASKVPSSRAVTVGEMQRPRSRGGRRRNVKSSVLQAIADAGMQGIPRDRLREDADRQGFRPGSFRVALNRLLESDVIEIDGILYLAKHADAVTSQSAKQEAAGASQGTPAASVLENHDGGKHAPALAALLK